MKNITATQRKLNILNKAIQNGFEIDEDKSFEYLVDDAESYLIYSEIDVKEEECEVRQSGRLQSVQRSDGMGYEFRSDGYIVDFSAHWHKDPSDKVFHTTVVDSDANVVRLFYFVGETEYNAPEGYYYSKREG